MLRIFLLILIVLLVYNLIKQIKDALAYKKQKKITQAIKDFKDAYAWPSGGVTKFTEDLVKYMRLKSFDDDSIDRAINIVAASQAFGPDSTN